MMSQLDDLIKEARAANRLMKKYGCLWGHPEFTVENWMKDVRERKTYRGYWAWVNFQIKESRTG